MLWRRDLVASRKARTSHLLGSIKELGDFDIMIRFFKEL